MNLEISTWINIILTAIIALFTFFQFFNGWKQNNLNLFNIRYECYKDLITKLEEIQTYIDENFYHNELQESDEEKERYIQEALTYIDKKEREIILLFNEKVEKKFDYFEKKLAEQYDIIGCEDLSEYSGELSKFISAKDELLDSISLFLEKNKP